ncbi:molybdopterin molybdotransferase [Pseudarthrobacter defluvii]|uniref:Molybdopterin molybdenumtransferase n=1 Tax=Pseudarthrobacter defluvii TaxID=410837 RepID=A0ABT9UN50_9MICC|nr:molybdopterin molybdotransferase MoeA [Pseudarthrobacter defluvii]MDQ0119679.1 molybdopterin molybdotransferase [Pseudarthrobacter defluvii]
MPANGPTATVSRSTAVPGPAPGPIPERGCIPWSEARHVAFGSASPLPPVAVPLADAIGRTLSRDVTALQDLPHYASSAMDGWAVNGPGPWLLAGSGQQGSLPREGNRFLPANSAAVIATGGLVPHGADAVLRKESGLAARDINGNQVLTLRPEAKAGEARSGQHIRPAGQEARSGEVLLPAGTVLNPAQVALAAAAGHDTVQVRARPAVAVVLTGAEVVTQGVPAPGQVRDTFGPQLGNVVSLLGGVADSPQRIGDSFASWLDALDSPVLPAGAADVIITTGGTGKSGTDHFRAAIDALGGQLLVDGIAMRPGHPAVLAGLPDGRFVIGLPGNPLAAVMALLTVGAPLIASLGGAQPPPLQLMMSGCDLEGDPGRTRLVPCRFLSGLAFPVQHTGPGMMRGLAWADAVMAVPPQGVDSGGPVPVLPLPWAAPETPRTPGAEAANPP